MRFYYIDTAGKRTALHVRPRGRPDVDDAVAIARGEIVPGKPLEFEFMKGASGSTACDWVSTSTAYISIVSTRLVNAIRQFRGWRTFPVCVYGKHGKRIPGYHGLAVIGRCGPIDNSRSVQQWRPPKAVTGKPYRAWVGLYFDESSWDGSDIFMPECTALICVTEPVKESVTRARLTNVRLVALSEMENTKLPITVASDG